jgi:hypothetical protein
MRLIDAETLELHEFIDSYIPQYTILSHTWGRDEVSLHDMLSGNANVKEGYEKIKRCCETAISDGFKYAWVDTCCIDKASSTELSEAINSMYRWYQESQVCYVILSDVPSDENCYHEISSFRRSRWFTRGWTLQELIAPSSVIFYGKDWKEIGTKSSLHNLIIEITCIHRDILLGTKYLGQFGIAQKMSWASRRETTRSEDIAYCLMGIFNVNMPLLYGEGEKAFLRLQEQIVNSSNDDSILAWTTATDNRSSCLAATPAAFAGAGNIISGSMRPQLPPTYGFSGSSHSVITNEGLYIQLEAIQEKENASSIRAVLRCRDQNRGCRVGIRLHKYAFRQAYVRVETSKLDFMTAEELQQRHGSTIPIYIEVDNELASIINDKSSLFACYVETRGLKENAISFVDMSPGVKCLDAPAPTFCWINLRGKNLTTLRFHDRSTDSHFLVILGHPNTGYRSKRPGALGVATIRQLQRTEKFSWPERLDPEWKNPDRMNWHDPTRKIWIKVAIRPHGNSRRELKLEVLRDESTVKHGDVKTADTNESQIEAKTYEVAQTFKVSIDWDMLGDASCYEPISLAKTTRSQVLETSIASTESKSTKAALSGSLLIRRSKSF